MFLFATGRRTLAECEEMAGSIEGRMPFMDTVLASVVACFSDEFLIGGNGGKAVLRAAMDKVLARKIVRRKKIGVRVPIGEWFRGPYRDFVQEMLVSERSRLAGMISRPKLRTLVAEHLAGRQNHEKK
jgi:asparagine synthase (glutamine-hydrolysing)